MFRTIFVYVYSPSLDRVEDNLQSEKNVGLSVHIGLGTIRPFSSLVNG